MLFNKKHKRNRQKSSSKKTYIVIWMCLSVMLTSIYYFSAAEADSSQKKAVIVNKDVPPGSILKAEDVTLSELTVPKKEQPFVIEDVEVAVGKQTVYGVREGRVVLQQDLKDLDEQLGEITVPIQAENLGDPGRLKVVDVWVRYDSRKTNKQPERLAEQVPLLAVFNRNNVSVFKEGVSDIVPRYVTLAGTPEQVKQIVDKIDDGQLFFVNPYPIQTQGGER